MSDSYFANVKTLLHFDGSDGSTTFTDSSTAAKSVTALGSAQLDTDQSKWGGSSLYVAANGALARVTSGSSDYLWGTGDFTLECWVRTSAVTQSIPFDYFASGEDSSWFLTMTAAGYLEWWTVVGGTSTKMVGATTNPINTGSWIHIAVSRNAGMLRLFSGGTKVGEVADSTDYAYQLTYFFLGGFQSGIYSVAGHIDDFRATKGVGRYTANFTPPTEAFPDYGPVEGLIAVNGILGEINVTASTPDAAYLPVDPDWPNVVLLVHFDGADAATNITDVSDSGHAFTAQGDAQLETTNPRWGSAAGKFDGTGDYWLATASSTDFDFASGDFTVEAWVYLDYLADSGSFAIIDNVTSGTANGFSFVVNSDRSLYLTRFNAGASNTFQSAVSAVPILQWAHVAAVRQGNDWKLYVDGVRLVNETLAVSIGASSQALRLGADYTAVSKWRGLIDDVRITKGYARYVGASFVPEIGYFGEEFIHVRGTSTAPTPLGAPQAVVLAVYGRVSIDSILGAPAVLIGLVFGSASAATMLGAANVVAFHSFSSQINYAAPVRYFADLVTPGGLVRVPISSWQVTLKADEQCYAMCVVPAVLDHVVSISEATEFIISASITLADGAQIVQERLRSPLATLSLDRGSYNYTATISGYYDGRYAITNTPPAATDVTLRGIRSQSVGSSTQRVRCAVDWLLAPSQRVHVGSSSFVSDYVNIYAFGSDSYMDVGESA